MDVFVETERLVLRRFTVDDFELLVELDSDPEVKRYIDGGAAAERQDLAAMLSSWLTYYDRYDGYGFWAAVEKPSGRVLGMVPSATRRRRRAT